MKLKELTVPKRMLIAIVAVFLAFSVAIGVSSAANAVTVSGTDAGCEYTVSDDTRATVASAYYCSTVQAFISATQGSNVFFATTPQVADTVGSTVYAITSTAPGGYAINASYATYYPGHGGVPAITIHAV